MTTGCKQSLSPAPAGSLRLTERQFRNSVAALFPFPVDAGAKLPASIYKDDFTTSIAGGEVLYTDIQGFADTAEAIALQALAHMSQLVPCAPAGDGAACAGQFIDGFATRAYRRPLEDTERRALLDLYAAVRAAPDALDFNLAIAAVIAAVLQSPQFLYRLELGEATSTPGVRKLTSYEVASRLSYLYWDGPPDAALLEKARAGALGDPAAVQAEAARLLGDPRARDSAWRFFSEWLGFGDRVFDSRADPALAADLAEEARRFVLGVAFDSPRRTLEELLSSGTTTIDRRLATHYGVALPGATSDNDWRAVTLPAPLGAGVLSKGQVAVAHSPVGDTSVVMRGKFVHERFLCFDLGTPPPGAQSMNPVLPADATARERVEARAKIPTCNTCHQYLDAAGLGMEDVDQLGRARTTYPSGRPIDASGTLRALPGDQDFVGTAGMARKLAGSQEVATCMVRQWYRYAMGRRESDAEERCQIAPLGKRFADSGHDLRQLLLGLSGSDAFLYRSEGTP